MSKITDGSEILDRWNFAEDDAQTIAGLITAGWSLASQTTYQGLKSLTFFRNNVQMEMSFEYTDKPVRNLHNKFADEGLDRCVCGSKYWENDRCVDCNTHVLVHRARFVAGA